MSLIHSKVYAKIVGITKRPTILGQSSIVLAGGTHTLVTPKRDIQNLDSENGGIHLERSDSRQEI